MAIDAYLVTYMFTQHEKIILVMISGQINYDATVVTFV